MLDTTIETMTKDIPNKTLPALSKEMLDSVMQGYIYAHSSTEGLTGYFSCDPEPSMSIDAALICLATRPLDTFLRSYLIRLLVALDDAAFADLWAQVFGEDTGFTRLWARVFNDAATCIPVQACLAESALARRSPVNDALAPRSPNDAVACPATRLLETLTREQYSTFCEASSLPDLAWYTSADFFPVRAWNAFIRPNILEHRALPFYDVDDEGDSDSDSDDDEAIVLPYPLRSPSPYEGLSLKEIATQMHSTQGKLAILHARMHEEDMQRAHEIWERPPAEETAALALTRLEAAGILEKSGAEPKAEPETCPKTEPETCPETEAKAEPETCPKTEPETCPKTEPETEAKTFHEARHEATLSPIGLLRQWRVSMRVRQGRHAYTVRGYGTTYGRGLSVPAARASCLMEMVERASAYVSVDTQDGMTFVTNRAVPTNLIRASYSRLVQEGRLVFDPNTLPLEVPYADQVIHWIEGFDFQGASVLVPFQAVCLFANLDEVDLCMVPSSTGLATGASLEDAIVSGCMEVFERDAEAALPWHRSQCFTVQTEDPVLAALLQAYEARDIHVFFRDMTGALGIPAYQACVRHLDGHMVHGAAANFSGKRALIAALTETPYPFCLKGSLPKANSYGASSPKADSHGADSYGAGSHEASSPKADSYGAGSHEASSHQPSAPALTGLAVRQVEALPDFTLANPARHMALIAELLDYEQSVQAKALSAKGIQPTPILSTLSNGQKICPVYVPLTRADLVFPVVRVLIPHKMLSADVDSFAKPHPHFMAQYCYAE